MISEGDMVILKIFNERHATDISSLFTLRTTASVTCQYKPRVDLSMRRCNIRMA